jgi:hypothetical protein
MSKGIMLVLIALWLCLIAVTGLNLYRQHQLGRLQTGILNDFKLISEIPDIFKDKQDSILQDISLKEKQRTKAAISFPLKDTMHNWLLLRIAAVCMTLITIAVYWFHFKRIVKE